MNVAVVLVVVVALAPAAAAVVVVVVVEEKTVVEKKGSRMFQSRPVSDHRRFRQESFSRCFFYHYYYYFHYYHSWNKLYIDHKLLQGRTTRILFYCGLSSSSWWKGKGKYRR